MGDYPFAEDPEIEDNYDPGVGGDCEDDGEFAEEVFSGGNMGACRDCPDRVSIGDGEFMCDALGWCEFAHGE